MTNKVEVDQASSEQTKLELLTELQAEGKVLEQLCVKSDVKAVEILSKIALLCVSNEDDDDFKNEVDERVEKSGFNKLNSDSVSDKLLKLVFGSKRRSRNFVYRHVLNEGLSQAKTGKEFIDWVDERGGMEAIAYKGNKKSKQSKKYLEAGRSFSEASNPIATFQADFINKKYTGTLVFVGNVKGGHVEIVCPLKNEEVNNYVFRYVGKRFNASQSLNEMRKKLLEDELKEIYVESSEIDDVPEEQC